MARAKWRLEGEWLKSCSCAYGCPCDFNARPTQGWCEGLLAMNIERGHFGEVRLDGLRFAATVDFPGPLHEGNGTMQPIIDERATQEQRKALLEIMSGDHSAPGTLFNIFSLIVSNIHDPVFAPFEWSFDQEARMAYVNVPGILESDVRPILNPVTHTPHRIQINMPEGFEHHTAEVACADIRSNGALRFEFTDSHSSLARVVQTPEGIAVSP